LSEVIGRVAGSVGPAADCKTVSSQHDLASLHHHIAINQSSKHLVNRVPLLIRKQMPVTANHLLSLMTHPLVNHALVDSRRSAVRGETVPQVLGYFSPRPGNICLN
jgi:hypothetical protein